jgi:preprotein translocase subunit SecD
MRRVIWLVAVLALSWGSLAYGSTNDFLPKLGLDLKGGISAILTAPEGTDPELLEQTVDVMLRRIEGIGGVQEPEISTQGDRNVLVQLPGVTDQEEALRVLGATGQLSFRSVLGTALPSQVDLTETDDPTQDAWIMDEDGTLAYNVAGTDLLGSSIEEAIALVGQGGRWEVNLVLDSEGADKFEAITAAAVQFPNGDPRNQVAIVLDGIVITSPAVNQAISGGSAVITMGAGEDNEAQAQDLSVVLRYGSLPVQLERSSLNKVSATVGQDSLDAGLKAGALGLLVVAAVLLIYYRSLGVVSVVGLTVFGSLLVMVFAVLGRSVGVTLTLAGVTGIIVSVGITADSYIVYFERIKEELRAGLDMTSAVETGFKKAYKTILTADTVSILGAFLLWLLAVGPVKGFAVSLGIATVLDIIIARYFTKNAVGMLAAGRWGEGGKFSIRGAAWGEKT